jgi:NAD(P)-dependent dehydrogenase (short-subunit alcohol dehydrogenase family)
MPERPVALVTGARRGIGRAIAEALAGQGFDLAVTDVAEEADGALGALRGLGAGALFLRADVGDIAGHAATVAAVVDRFGRVDCLVNNAGIASPVRGDLLELQPEHFDRVMAVNLRGPLFLTQAVARWMLANPPADGRSRSIVNVSSVSAELASPERADYCLSKAGIAMLTRLLALRLAEAGIGVFEVRPGIVRTDMTSAAAERYDRLIAGGLVPMRRWGEGRDVGSVVAALAGGAFIFATGTVVHADGGLSIHRL